MKHLSVLLQEILGFLPDRVEGSLLDVTAGGGGHFFAVLEARPEWKGECWDRDPAARERIDLRGKACKDRYIFEERCFGEPKDLPLQSFILADLGISSFQLDDPARGLSFHSASTLDFRMNPHEGPIFSDWLRSHSVHELERIFQLYGEEPKAKQAAKAIKELDPALFASSQATSEALMASLRMKKLPHKSHPLTRIFQALRIAINDELGELDRFLAYAPALLEPGGRLAVISFHSLEDRKVKRAFQERELKGYKILTPKALSPSTQEERENPRSRSAKLRVLERMESDS